MFEYILKLNLHYESELSVICVHGGSIQSDEPKKTKKKLSVTDVPANKLIVMTV